jgi:hypothetical protein
MKTNLNFIHIVTINLKLKLLEAFFPIELLIIKIFEIVEFFFCIFVIDKSQTYIAQLEDI